MSRIHVEVERVLDAKPEDVYTFLANYTDKHPTILPPDNYLDYTVVSGGRGAGTVFRYRFRAARRERRYEMTVEEPSRGRVLLERDTGSSLVTTWTITPTTTRRQTRVAITTEWEGSGGVGGFFERTFAPLGLRRVYTDLLERLTQAVAPASSVRARAS